MNLAERVGAMEPRAGPSPWADHEYLRGYTVMAMPFSSGQMLALRVFPESSFAPYASVWHRAADGRWSLFNDGPMLDVTCARWWGPAAERAELADIDVEWTGPNELRVTMAEPRLEWTMTVGASPMARVVNAASSSTPLRLWRSDAFVGVQEWLTRRYLGIDAVRLAFQMPSGHDTVLVPEETYFVTDSEAEMEGRSLGDPQWPDEAPTIGDVVLPPRAFVVGQAQMRMPDPEESAAVRERVRRRLSDGTGPASPHGTDHVPRGGEGS